MSIRGCLGLFGLCLAVTGCQPTPVGAYQAEGGEVTYRLEPGGRAYVTVLGTTVAATYTADAERGIVSGPQGTTVLARREGALLGPTGLVLHRIDTPD